MRRPRFLPVFCGFCPDMHACGQLSEVKFVDNRPREIRSVRLDKQSVEVFSPVELSADIVATYKNPFDPEQIAVDADVTAPNGKTTTVPGFYYAPVRLETKSGAERLEPRPVPPTFAFGIRRRAKGGTGWC